MHKKSKDKGVSIFSDGEKRSKSKRAPKPRNKLVASAVVDTFIASLMDDKTAPVEDAEVDSLPSLTGFGDIFAALDNAATVRRDQHDGEIPDAKRLMDLAISADLDPTIFTEQSFPVAENVIDWCRNPQFLGFTGELWPRQVQVLSRFFGDVCYFCSDVDYVHNTPVDDTIGTVLDKFVLLKHGVCPMCRRNRTEMLDDWIHDSKFSRYNDYDEGVDLVSAPPNEFVGVWGQRSSKSYTVASFAAPYVLHRYVALPNPTRYFDRPSNIVLEMAFVAPTLHQVDENMWMPFRGLYDSSPWFREVKNHLVAEGKRIGIPLYHAAATFVLFPGKRIAVWKLAASSQTLRGATRIFACVDELAWFNSTADGRRRSGVKDGVEVFNSLSNSLSTIRSAAARRRERLRDYNALDAYMFNISSPCSVSDPIMQQAAIASQHPRMYYTHYATWEVNPWEDQQTIIEQTAGRPEVYKRDFCAIPPRALSPFYPNASHIHDLEIKQETQQLPLFNYMIQQYRDTVEHGNALLRPTLLDINPDPFGSRILAVDNGEVDNSFALCVASFDPVVDGVVYDKFVEVAPQRGLVVDLAWCYSEFIVPLIKAYNILFVVFDRWNSAHQVMDLRTNHGIKAERYTLRWADYDAFRDDLSNAKMRFPAAEVPPDSLLQLRPNLRSQHPSAHFQLQLTTVEQFGKKMFKPENGNDDLFRVAVSSHAFVKKHKDMLLKSAGRRAYSGESRVTGSLFRGASNRSVGGSISPRSIVGAVQEGRGVGAFYPSKRKSLTGV